MKMSEAGKLGWIASKEKHRLRYELIQKEYLENPSRCSNCGCFLDYKKRKNKYCSSSCSASVSNASRNSRQQFSFCCFCKTRIPKRQKYCSKHCESNDRTISAIIAAVFSPEDKTPESAARKIRMYLLEVYDGMCQNCGYFGINDFTGNNICQIHHKNGDHRDNRVENLEILCPNCHAKTTNYMNCGNRRSTRSYRRKQSAEPGTIR